MSAYILARIGVWVGRDLVENCHLNKTTITN